MISPFPFFSLKSLITQNQLEKNETWKVSVKTLFELLCNAWMGVYHNTFAVRQVYKNLVTTHLILNDWLINYYGLTSCGIYFMHFRMRMIDQSDRPHFVLVWHTKLDLYCANSQKQQPTDRHVTPSITVWPQARQSSL